MFFRPKSNVIRYCGFRSNSYELTEMSRDCYVKEGDYSVATFEMMSLSGDTLHIDHFAVDSSLRGCGKAEQVLRGFAQLVAEQAPHVTRITFDLYRSSEGSDIVKLAHARFALLKRIGAREVSQRQPNEHCICVSGVWEKALWSE